MQMSVVLVVGWPYAAYSIILISVRSTVEMSPNFSLSLRVIQATCEGKSLVTCNLSSKQLLFKPSHGPRTRGIQLGRQVDFN